MKQSINQQSGMGNLGRIWLSHLDPLVYLLSKTLWFLMMRLPNKRFFQKHAVHRQLDVCVLLLLVKITMWEKIVLRCVRNCCFLSWIFSVQ